MSIGKVAKSDGKSAKSVGIQSKSLSNIIPSGIADDGQTGTNTRSNRNHK